VTDEGSDQTSADVDAIKGSRLWQLFATRMSGALHPSSDARG
jgi:hypothetical protein